MLEDIVIRHHYEDEGFRSRRSPTAVCLAGEARSLVVPQVRGQLARNMLRPFEADLFLAMSPRWDKMPLTAGRLLEIEADLHPVSTVVAPDALTARALAGVLRHSSHSLHQERRHAVATSASASSHCRRRCTNTMEYKWSKAGPGRPVFGIKLLTTSSVCAAPSYRLHYVTRHASA